MTESDQLVDLSAVPTGTDPSTGEWAAARARIEEAHEWVADLCSGKRTWRMRIPVDRSDSDVTISDALTFGEAALDEIDRLTALVRDLGGQP